MTEQAKPKTRKTATRGQKAQTNGAAGSDRPSSSTREKPATRQAKVDTRGKTPAEVAAIAQAMLDAQNRSKTEQAGQTKATDNAREKAARQAMKDHIDAQGGDGDGAVEWLDPDPAERDIVTSAIQPPRMFRSEDFARANIALVDSYATYRVMGMNPERAFCRVFGTDYADVHLSARIEAFEHNVVYRQVFANRFGSTPLNRMFSVRQAVWQWLSLLNNPFTRETVRATAIQQLQTIYGITVTDEGVTKATKSLDDFYRDEQNAESELQAVRHPDPGSEAAIEFERAMREKVH
jgi:hypothetical protein